MNARPFPPAGASMVCSAPPPSSPHHLHGEGTDEHMPSSLAPTPHAYTHINLHAGSRDVAGGVADAWYRGGTVVVYVRCCACAVV